MSHPSRSLEQKLITSSGIIEIYPLQYYYKFRGYFCLLYEFCTLTRIKSVNNLGSRNILSYCYKYFNLSESYKITEEISFRSGECKFN